MTFERYLKLLNSHDFWKNLENKHTKKDAGTKPASFSIFQFKKNLAKILYEKFEQGLFSHTIYSDPYIEI